MPDRSRKTPDPAGDAQDQEAADDALDQQLKRLGDAFLQEDVPDALLDVLRRGAKSRAGEKRAGKKAEPSDTSKHPDRQQPKKTKD